MFSHALPPPPLPPGFLALFSLLCPLFFFHLNNLLEVQMAFQTDETEAENEV